MKERHFFQFVKFFTILVSITNIVYLGFTLNIVSTTIIIMAFDVVVNGSNIL